MFRRMKLATLLSAAIGILAPLLNAQFDFDVAGRKVQIHGFASQGFVYTNDNNF